MAKRPVRRRADGASVAGPKAILPIAFGVNGTGAKKGHLRPAGSGGVRRYGGTSGGI